MNQHLKNLMYDAGFAEPEMAKRSQLLAYLLLRDITMKARKHEGSCLSFAKKLLEDYSDGDKPN